MLNQVQQQAEFIISPAVKEKIDHWLEKYPQQHKQSAIIAALLLVQEQNSGWLSEAAMNATADYLGLPHIAAYEVATFYDMYNLKPIGKHKISICTNVSCLLRGSDKIVSCLQKRLGVGLGETTADGQFTLNEVECLAACAGAPMCQIDDKAYHENLTPEKMLALIDKIMAQDLAEEQATDD